VNRGNPPGWNRPPAAGDFLEETPDGVVVHQDSGGEAGNTPLSTSRHRFFLKQEGDLVFMVHPTMQ